MEVQINEAFAEADTEIHLPSGTTVSIPPPLDGSYWLLRVPVSDNQAIIGFPKFFTIGIGFQVEEDWNTNLPYTCDARMIFDHIAHNKGDDTISDDLCIEAIKAIQALAPTFLQER